MLSSGNEERRGGLLGSRTEKRFERETKQEDEEEMNKGTTKPGTDALRGSNGSAGEASVSRPQAWRDPLAE